MKKIGILGGTFDPPHIGHLIIAQEVREQIALDEIWFIPTNIPPHKQTAYSSAKARVHMLEHAIAGNNHFHVDTIEVDRNDISYTLHTIQALKKQYTNTQFYFIIGADMVEYLPSWYKIEELMQEISFIGVKRQGYQLATNYPVKAVDIPLIDVSSSMIRKRIMEKRPYEYFVTERVSSYIKEHRLYEDE